MLSEPKRSRVQVGEIRAEGSLMAEICQRWQCWTERRVGAVSRGFTEDHLEGLGLWEPLDPDPSPVSTYIPASWEAS